MSKKMTSRFNAVELPNRMAPFEHQHTREVWVNRSIKGEDSSKEEEQMLFASTEGVELLTAVLTDLIGDSPTKQEMQEAERLVRSRAKIVQPRLPTNPVTRPKVETTGEVVGRELDRKVVGTETKVGTLPDAAEVPLPTNILRIYLDLDGKTMVQLLEKDDGRTLPINHPAVKAVIYLALKKKLGRTPKPQEFHVYLLRCSGEALQEYRSLEADEKSEFSDEEMLVLAVLGMLSLRTQRGEGAFSGTQTVLRNTLVEVAKYFELDDSGWPEGRHFTDFLWRAKGMLARREVTLRYKRSNGKRMYTVRWTKDPEPVDKESVPQSAAKPTNLAALPPSDGIGLTKPTQHDEESIEETAEQEAKRLLFELKLQTAQEQKKGSADHEVEMVHSDPVSPPKPQSLEDIEAAQPNSNKREPDGDVKQR